VPIKIYILPCVRILFKTNMSLIQSTRIPRGPTASPGWGLAPQFDNLWFQLCTLLAFCSYFLNKVGLFRRLPSTAKMDKHTPVPATSARRRQSLVFIKRQQSGCERSNKGKTSSNPPNRKMNSDYPKVTFINTDYKLERLCCPLKDTSFLIPPPAHVASHGWPYWREQSIRSAVFS
jgi:hypothetical protein